jgi:dihydrofolate reductase
VNAASPPRIAIVLLAAVADNGVIGRENALPFRQSSDLKRFKAMTMGKPIVMGRKTYDSIGKPLPGRTNIVISRDPSFTAPGIVATTSVKAALATARGDALRRGADEIVVIGGTEIFVQTMPIADRLEITQVHAQPAGDTFFPPIDEKRWRETARNDYPAGPRDEANFTYVTYATRAPGTL